MKKILYSNFMKFIACTVFVCSVMFSANIALNCSKSQISWKYVFSDALLDGRGALDSVLCYVESYSQGNITAEELNDVALHNSDKLYFYMEINNGQAVFGKEADIEKCKKSERHFLLNTYKNDYFCEDTTGMEYPTEYLPKSSRIMLAVRDDYYSAQEKEAQKAKKEFERILNQYIVLLAAALLALAYLAAVCGKHGDDEEIHMWIIDRMYSEITLLLALVSAAAAVLPAVIGITAPEVNMTAAVLFGVGFFALLFLMFALSVVRNIKNRTFLKRSLIAKMFRYIFRVVKKAAKEIKLLLSKKSGAIAAVMLIIYTIVVSCFGTVGSIFGIVAGLFFIGVRTREFNEIKKGAAEIKSGKLDYKIPQLKCEDYSAVADDINDIGEGISSSVAEKIRAERMKTELITNVSHDLKTPLTSIINYAQLLENTENLPEEAADYVKIILKKSERLKKLTSDLFDITKVQSGNEVLNTETLDLSLLINQSLAEYDEEIKKSGLNFCVNLEDELYISADGKKMSRVIGNLINNALKYSMQGTRVFVSARRTENGVFAEFKNISAYPIDFDSQEITERFVRGDKSRSEEGSGLGLAIAKEYTEVCGGKFEIVTDGDMFKAVIVF